VQASGLAPGDEPPDGVAERRRVGALLGQMGEEFASIGIQLGARYDGSPVVLGDGTQAPPDRPDVYEPSATPGGKLKVSVTAGNWPECDTRSGPM